MSYDRSTVEAVIQHYFDAVHEGDADDKDLKKAIGEATKAVEHLKSFLKKA